MTSFPKPSEVKSGTTAAPTGKGNENRVALNVSAVAFNADQSLAAVAPNNDNVDIWDTKGGQDPAKWEKKQTLLEHGGWVSSIDWCAATNMIVTCGHDRNAYVWRFVDKDAKSKYSSEPKEGEEEEVVPTTGKVWKPTLVILRINRAATMVKWSPNGNKFAVASGAKCVPICHFEETNDWWISKMIKKHKSTVLSLAWCCNNKFIVTGSCDMKCRVFSAYIAGIDPEEDDGFGEVWANQHKFGEVLVEFNQAQSWVQGIAWSAGGFRIAFTGHNSTIHFAQILAGSEPIVQSVPTKGLPFVDLAYLSDNTLLAVGFDMNPAVFSVSGGSDADPKWSFQEQLDKEEKVEDKGPAKSGSTVGNARAMFQAQASQGIQMNTSSAAKGSTAAAKAAVPTRHTNLINVIWPIKDASNGTITKFITSGVDGRVLWWDLDKLKVPVK